jgi:hypothetical protein
MVYYLDRTMLGIILLMVNENPDTLTYIYRPLHSMVSNFISNQMEMIIVDYLDRLFRFTWEFNYELTMIYSTEEDQQVCGHTFHIGGKDC